MNLRDIALGLVFCWTHLSVPTVCGEDPPTPEAQGSDRVVYVCPSCGCVSDSKSFDKPGKCPDCKMGLVRKEPFHAPRKVAIMIFEGAGVLEMAGPADVFSNTLSTSGRAFEVITVAPTKESVDSRNAILTITPAYWVENCPKPDVVVVPGGSVDSITSDPHCMDWLKKCASEGAEIMSVANGSLALAKAGLLDDHEATTIWWAAKRMQSEFPKVKVVDDRRVVEAGKIVTASSPAAGLDAALVIVEHFHGPEAAQNTSETLDLARSAQKVDGKP